MKSNFYTPEQWKVIRKNFRNRKKTEYLILEAEKARLRKIINEHFVFYESREADGSLMKGLKNCK